MRRPQILAWRGSAPNGASDASGELPEEDSAVMGTEYAATDVDGTPQGEGHAETAADPPGDATLVGIVEDSERADDTADTKDTGRTEDGKDGGDVGERDHDDQSASVAADDGVPAKPRRRIAWARVLAMGVLPAVALLLAIVAAFFKWQSGSIRADDIARIDSVAAAKDSTVALLSYQPDNVENTLAAASDRLTGTFRDSYTQLTKDVVIPGAKEKHISATATVPAAASVSATPTHAVVLVFVNQTTVVSTSPPTDTASAVRVTLDKDGDRWLISAFDPI